MNKAEANYLLEVIENFKMVDKTVCELIHLILVQAD